MLAHLAAPLRKYNAKDGKVRHRLGSLVAPPRLDDDGVGDAAGGDDLVVADVCDSLRGTASGRRRRSEKARGRRGGVGPGVRCACPAPAGPDREREAGGVATPLPPAAAAVLAAGAKLESDSFLYVPSLLAGGVDQGRLSRR